MLKTFRNAGLCALALVLLLGFPVLAQESENDLRQEIEALKQGQKNIQKQLNEIKRLLQTQQRAQQPSKPRGPQVKDVVFDIANGKVKGDNSAQLTLIEFTDYQ